MTPNLSTANRPRKNIVLAAIRRSNRNRLLLGGVVLLGIIICYGLAWDYIQAALAGPRPIRYSELVGIKDPGQVKHNWVIVEGDDIVDTGWERTETTYWIFQRTEYRYFILQVGNDLLLTAYSGGADELPPTTLTGSLESISSPEQSNVVLDIRRQVPEVADALLPYKLAVNDFRTPGFIGAGIAVIALLIATYFISKGLIMTFNPTRHELYRKAAGYGSAEAVMAQISEETAKDQAPKRIGSTQFTRNWLVTTKSGLNFMPYERIVWLYGSITRHSVNGIPTGRSYGGMVWDRQGNLLKLGGRKGQVETMLKEVISRASWAIVGYDQTLMAAWTKDRNGFLAAVEQRKQEMRSAGPTPRPAERRDN